MQKRIFYTIIAVAIGVLSICGRSFVSADVNSLNGTGNEDRQINALGTGAVTINKSAGTGGLTVYDGSGNLKASISSAGVFTGNGSGLTNTPSFTPLFALRATTYYAHPMSTTTTTAAVGLSNFRMLPFWCPNNVTLVRLGADVTTASTDTGSSFADGTITSGSATLTSTTTHASWVSTDVGRMVTGTGIPTNTYILSQAGTSATMSQNATQTFTGNASVTLSGPQIRFGIYNDDGSGVVAGVTNGFGLPSTLLLDANTINGASQTYQEVTISQALTANTWYWIGWATQGGTNTPTLRVAGAGSGGPGTYMNFIPLTVGGAAPASGTVSYGYMYASTTVLSALPSPLTVGSIAINNATIPRIIFKTQ